MMGAFGGIEIIFFLLISFLPAIFIGWMIYRFVKAQEKIADGIYEIKGHLQKMSPDDHTPR